MPRFVVTNGTWLKGKEPHLKITKMSFKKSTEYMLWSIFQAKGYGRCWWTRQTHRHILCSPKANFLVRKQTTNHTANPTSVAEITGHSLWLSWLGFPQSMTRAHTFVVYRTPSETPEHRWALSSGMHVGVCLCSQHCATQSVSLFLGPELTDPGSATPLRWADSWNGT